MEGITAQSGSELLKAIQGMRQFLGDISKLLQTAESLLEEKQWDPIGDSTTPHELSYRLNAGHLWMPRECTRFYESATSAGIVLAVTVLLDDYDREYRLSEPLVSGTVFRLPSDSLKARIEKWQCRWFGWCDISADGTVCRKTNSAPDWETKYVWTEMQVFAQPLVAVKDEITLKTLIVDPLVRMAFAST